MFEYSESAHFVFKKPKKMDDNGISQIFDPNADQEDGLFRISQLLSNNSDQNANVSIREFNELKKDLKIKIVWPIIILIQLVFI